MEASTNRRRILRNYSFLVPITLGIVLLFEIPALGHYCYQSSDECAAFLIPFFPFGIALVCAGVAMFMKKRFYLTRLESLVIGILIFTAIIGVTSVFFSGVYFR